MSNQLGQIYGTVKNAETYIVLNSENVELSGNVYINGGLATDNSFGVSGEILISQGSTSAPIWGSALIDVSNLDASSVSLIELSNNTLFYTPSITVTDVSNLDASSVSLIELSNNTLFYTPLITAFGSFQLTAAPQPTPNRLNLTNNATNNIIGLANQNLVTPNGMSVDSATGIITLNTSGVYLLNASFRVHQTTGVGGLINSDLFVANSLNVKIISIDTFIDQQTSGDTYRTCTMAGHAVIIASTNNFQLRLVLYCSSTNTPIAILGGDDSAGVSIQRIS